MKTTIKFFMGTMLIGAFLIVGCRKYDEGGPVRKADKTLVKEWSREKGFKGGTAVTQVPENPQIGEITENMIFSKDGTYRSENGTVAISGTWKLVKRDKQVEITITSPSANASTYTYDIIKLTDGSDGQLFLEHTLNGILYRYEARSSN